MTSSARVRVVDDSGAGRVPPHDLDAEAAVLSSVLVDPTALAKVAPFLKPEHFYSESHRLIFEACAELAARAEAIDVVNVGTLLKSNGRIAQVGGMAYLTEVLNAAPFVANAATYGRTIFEKWRVRQLIATCQTVAAQGYVDYGDAGAFIADALERVAVLERATFKPSSPPSCTPLAVLDAWESEGPLIHEPTGIAALDDVTGGGLVYGSRTFLVGAPDAGKTALLVQLGDVFARRGGIVAGFYVVDEEPGDILTRVLQRANFTRADCEHRGADLLRDMRELVDALPIVFFDATYTIERAAAELAERAASSGSRAFLGVDSIQTVTCDELANRRDDVSPREAVSANVRAFRAVASKHRLLAVATSEMNRGGYRSTDVAEQTNDMAVAKESGAIEYSARVMLALRSVKGEPDLVEARVVKNKHGASGGSIYLRLDRRHMRLEQTDAPESSDREAVRGDAARQRSRADAAAVLLAVAKEPGVRSHALRALLREGGAFSKDRVLDGVLVLETHGALVAIVGAHGAKHLYIDGARIPAEVMALVPIDRRPALAAMRVPTVAE
jgi:replicative DNA helicase